MEGGDSRHKSEMQMQAGLDGVMAYTASLRKNLCGVSLPTEYVFQMIRT
jgi:hypothetical protein